MKDYAKDQPGLGRKVGLRIDKGEIFILIPLTSQKFLNKFSFDKIHVTKNFTILPIFK